MPRLSIERCTNILPSGSRSRFWNATASDGRPENWQTTPSTNERPRHPRPYLALNLRRCDVALDQRRCAPTFRERWYAVQHLLVLVVVAKQGAEFRQVRFYGALRQSLPVHRPCNRTMSPPLISLMDLSPKTGECICQTPCGIQPCNTNSSWAMPVSVEARTP